MNKHIGIWMAFLLFSSALEAQNLIDSLENGVKNSSNVSDKINYLNELARITVDEDLSKAEEYAQKVLKLTQTTTYPGGKANALQHLGDIYTQKSEYPQAEKFFGESLEIYQSLNDATRQGFVLSGLGLTKYYQSAFKQAITYLEEAKSIFERQKNKEGLVEVLSRIGVCHYALAEYAPALEAQLKVLKITEELEDAGSRFYNQLQANLNVGAIYKQLDDSDKAILYFETAKQLAQQEQDDWSLAGALTNIGTVYDDQNKLDEAKKNYEEALQIFTSLEDASSQAVVCNNLGDIYRKMGNYKASLQNHLKSLKIKEEIGDQKGVANSFNSIALLYKDQQEYKQAHIYLDKALKIAVKIKADDVKRDILKLTAEVYAKEENYASAYKYYQEYAILKDSIMLSTSSMAALLGQYGASQKELKLKMVQTEVKLKNAELRAERLYLYLLIAIILGIIAGFSLGIDILRKSNRLRRLKARLKEEGGAKVSKPTS